MSGELRELFSALGDVLTWILMTFHRSLRSLVQDFRDLAEVCLLLLHLEVRVHCFYYLLPVTKQVCNRLVSCLAISTGVLLVYYIHHFLPSPTFKQTKR